MDGRNGKVFKRYRYTTDYYRKIKCIRNTRQPAKSSSSSLSCAIETSSDGSANNTVQMTPIINTTFTNISENEDSEDVSNISANFLGENGSDCEQFTNIVGENISLINELREWGLQYKLTHCSLTALLKILRNHGRTELPKDSRSLLGTPKEISLIDIGSGQMWYQGIRTNLLLALQDINHSLTVSLKFNIDGMSPYSSSPLEFWPILLIIDELKHLKPMVISVYYGHGKPPLDSFLTPFVDELNGILEQGLTINQHKVQVKIKCFICDTPARCFIKGVTSFNSENGACLKCTVVGEWDKRGRHMSYPRIHCPRRSDESFRNKLDEDHHKEETPLLKLPMNLIEDIPIADSLHLFDLGIMRKCLYGWCYGNYNYRTKMSAADIINMSSLLEGYNETKPREVHRAIRGLKFLKHWKGSEYRTFLLYLGPVILKDFLPREAYEHFLVLSCAVIILMSKHYMKFLLIADSLLTDYIQEFINIYGIDSISSNVHNLCHVADDVRKFGPLPEISSYPFENFLGYLKYYLRSGHRPLAQIAKRICELSKLEDNSKTQIFPNVREEDCVGLSSHKLHSMGKMYRRIYLTKNLTLSSDIKNKWFMTKNSTIVGMRNVINVNGKLCVDGCALKSKCDFFIKPFKSSNLDIYLSTGETNIPDQFDLDDIKCKLFSLKYHDKVVFFPLIHTLD